MSNVDKYFFLDNISHFVYEKCIDPLFAVYDNSFNFDTCKENKIITFVYSSEISDYISINEPSPFLNFEIDDVSFFGYDLKRFLKFATTSNIAIYEVLTNNNVLYGQDYLNPVKETILETYIPEKLINYYNINLNNFNLWGKYLTEEFDAMLLPTTLRIIKHLLFMHCLENYKTLPSSDVKDILTNHANGIPSLSQDLIDRILSIISSYKHEKRKVLPIVDESYKPIFEWIKNSSRHFDDLTSSKKFNETIERSYSSNNKEKIDKLNKILINTILVYF